jgi:hypothetical protein
MMKLLLWLVLLVLCWPLALLALVLWPLFWLLSLPFRLVGIAFEGVFELLRAILFRPAGRSAPLARLTRTSPDRRQRLRWHRGAWPKKRDGMNHA